MAGTLDELAALSGVSRATVSRVINGGSVSPSTRDRVLAVIETHEPSTERRGPDARLGPVGRDRGGHARRAARAVRRPVLRAAPAWHERRALRTGRRDDALARQPIQGGDPEPHPVARAPRRRHRHRRQPGRSARRRVARLRPAHGAPRASAGGSVGELRRRRPRPRGRRDDLPLVDLGRRRVAHITGRRGTVAGEDRLTGYRRAMERAGLPTDGLVVEGASPLAPGDRRGRSPRSRCRCDLLRERRHGRRCPPDHPLARLDGPGRRRARGVRRSGVRRASGPTVDDHPTGGATAGGRGRPRPVRVPVGPRAGPRRVLLPTELVVRASTVGGGAP